MIILTHAGIKKRNSKSLDYIDEYIFVFDWQHIHRIYTVADNCTNIEEKNIGTSVTLLPKSDNRFAQQ